MSSLDERARGLDRFGFTPRQAKFVATVALHSGYCLRRQYAAFANLGFQAARNLGQVLGQARKLGGPVDFRVAGFFFAKSDILANGAAK